MSFLPVLEYLFSYGIFALVYWLLDGILALFIALGVGSRGDTYTLMMYYWTGSIIVFVIFSGVWLARMYNEKQYWGG